MNQKQIKYIIRILDHQSARSFALSLVLWPVLIADLGPLVHPNLSDLGTLVHPNLADLGPLVHPNLADLGPLVHPNL